MVVKCWNELVFVTAKPWLWCFGDDADMQNKQLRFTTTVSPNNSNEHGQSSPSLGSLSRLCATAHYLGDLPPRYARTSRCASRWQCIPCPDYLQNWARDLPGHPPNFYLVRSSQLCRNIPLRIGPSRYPKLPPNCPHIPFFERACKRFNLIYRIWLPPHLELHGDYRWLPLSCTFRVVSNAGFNDVQFMVQVDSPWRDWKHVKSTGICIDCSLCINVKNVTSVYIHVELLQDSTSVNIQLRERLDPSGRSQNMDFRP